MPGLIERETGRVLFSPNFGWRDVPLQEKLKEVVFLLMCSIISVKPGSYYRRNEEIHGSQAHLLHYWSQPGIWYWIGSSAAKWLGSRGEWYKW